MSENQSWKSEVGGIVEALIFWPVTKQETRQLFPLSLYRQLMIKGTSGLETHSKVNKSLFIKVSTIVKYFRCMSRFSMAFFCFFLIIFLFFMVYGFVCLFVCLFFFFSLFIFNLFSLLPFYFKLFLSLFFKSNFYTLFPRISAQALI